MKTEANPLGYSDRPRGSQKHILVVDDEILFLYSLEFFLTRASYEVTLKSSAREALELLKADRERYDLLILDILIPEFTGLDLIDALTSLEISIPIIVITGYATREIESKVRQCNIKGYLCKPFPYKELLDIVEDVLQTKEIKGESTDDCA
jgi:DNA-binding NtrC family response regulator